MTIRIYFLLLVLFVISACSQMQMREQIDFEEWGDYWYQGNAEINSFELTQYRYGEPREGEAILIFVTEDFSQKRHVKLDQPNEAGKDKVSVLKMNQTRDFITGIYPYHMMLSAFTPIKAQSQGLKFVASVQEWCGHTFSQLNLKSDNDYRGVQYSYFEKEGDSDFTVSGLSEDDLWNLIRISPGIVPVGSVSVFPSLFYQRLSHRELAAEEAFIRILDISEDRSRLELKYSSGVRELKIDFEKEFPYQIMAWEEIHTLSNGDQEITKATRKSVKMIDYWTKNKTEDTFLRNELMLQEE